MRGVSHVQSDERGRGVSAGWGGGVRDVSRVQGDGGEVEERQPCLR